MDKSILEDKKAILSTDYIPQYEQLYIHPEEGEDFKLNNSLLDIYNDMKFLDHFLITKANDLDDLVYAVTQRLEGIDLDIKSEQERLQDIKMLCNKFTDFDNVIPITEETSMSGEYSVKNNTFYCAVSSQKKAKLFIDDIVGNGIEGNKYVYQDFAYVKDSVDTSNRSFITDSSVTSYYEYERITASSTEEYIISDFNTDSEHARCTVELHSETDMNLITITSDNDSLYIVGVQYSHNGVDYTPLEIPMIKLNDKLASYDNYDYVCGDNKLWVPLCRFVKITFQSEGTTDETIAYDRIMFSHTIEKTDEEKMREEAEDGIIGGYIGEQIQEVAPTYNEIEDATVVIKSAKRHVIKLNDIQAVHNQYKGSSYFKTGNLISDGDFYAAALFVNAYIPDSLDSESLKFIFTINGIDYEVSPVNSTAPGHKIFRYSQGKSITHYTQLLTEPIKNLYLTIKFKGTNEITPFVGNIKVLLGGEI